LQTRHQRREWFNPTKGFGFISPVDGSKDVFVHISAVERSELDTIREGQKKITYGLERGRQERSRRSIWRPPSGSRGRAPIGAPHFLLAHANILVPLAGSVVIRN